MELALTYIVYTILVFLLYFQVFSIVTLIFDNNTDNKQNNLLKESSFVPSVSILVPCWNEEKTIKKTLVSLSNLKYPKEKLNIIVIDDGSTDKTYQIAKSFASTAKNITVLTKENGGKHSALNYGAQFTDADIIGCLDADSVVEPDALQHIVDKFKDKNVAATVAVIKTQNNKTILQKAQQVEYIISVFIRKFLSTIDSLFITPGPFSFYRHSILKKVGYWKKAHLTEDLEMGLRLQKNKYKIAYVDNAIIYTNTPATILTLIKQRVRWVYGFLMNIIDYKDMLFNPKYGNLGVFVLPSSFVSIFFIVFLFAYVIYTTLQFIFIKIKELLFAGMPNFSLSFDSFYIYPTFVTFLTLISILMVIYALFIGKQIAKEKKISGLGFLYYVSVYTFIAPIWIVKAINKAYIKKDTISWR